MARLNTDLQLQCVGVTISGSIIICIGAFIGIYIAYKLISALSSQSIKILFYKIVFTSSIISYLLIVTCTFSATIFTCIDWELYWSISRGAQFFYFCMLLPLLLMIFTARLHFTFKHTAYEISPYIIHCFAAVIVIIMICNLVYFYISIDFVFLDNNYLYFIGRLLILCSFVLYFILAVILVAIFIRQLNGLIFDQRSSVMDVTKLHLSPRQSKLIAMVSKYAVISCFAFAINFLLTMVVMCMALSFNSFIFSVIVHQIEFVDAVCNIICLYLQFNFASDDYRHVCGFCHNLCKKRLRKNMTRQMSERWQSNVVPSDSMRSIIPVKHVSEEVVLTNK